MTMMLGHIVLMEIFLMMILSQGTNRLSNSEDVTVILLLTDKE